MGSVRGRSGQAPNSLAVCQVHTGRLNGDCGLKSLRQKTFACDLPRVCELAEGLAEWLAEWGGDRKSLPHNNFEKIVTTSLPTSRARPLGLA